MLLVGVESICGETGHSYPTLIAWIGTNNTHICSDNQGVLFQKYIKGLECKNGAALPPSVAKTLAHHEATGASFLLGNRNLKLRWAMEHIEFNCGSLVRREAFRHVFDRYAEVFIGTF